MRSTAIAVLFLLVAAGCGSGTAAGDTSTGHEDTGSGGDTTGHDGRVDHSGGDSKGDTGGGGDETGSPDADIGDPWDADAGDLDVLSPPDLLDVDGGQETIEDAADSGDSDSEADEIAEIAPPCDVGEPCDDMNPCTLNDQCVDGLCEGTPKVCEDGIACTIDVCIDGECVASPTPGWCYIWEQCWKDGEKNPNNPCLECITAHRIYTWTANDNNLCDDGSVCTIDDRCSDGACAGKAMLCDDGNPCTLDVCDGGYCDFILQDGIACDDGNICTMNDVCEDGGCVGGGDERECNDFNPCTVDTCDPVMGCIYTPFNGFCDDGNECTLGDKCVNSVCKSGAPLVCDDNNSCTNDYCNPLVGCKFINNSYPCDDGDPCTVGDKCLGGICKKGPDKLVCEDENTCTMEYCAPTIGCKHVPIPNAQCSDFNSCTYGDKCVAGVCTYEFAIECDDGNPCTDDVCDEAFGCAHYDNSHPCDDGNACTTGDQCVQGQCVTGLLPVHCFEENPCLDGYCDPVVGCVATPLNGAPCNDGDMCTLDDICVDGECFHGVEALNCDDGNVCTLDFCDPVFGCVYETITLPCNDFNICTANDRCMDGMCQGTQVSCNDNNSCTVDMCDISQGCYHSVIVSEFCQPRIVIDYPPRAAELVGPPTTIQVQGHVVHNAAPASWIKVNGQDVVLGPGGTFTVNMAAHQGVNLIEAEIFDKLDGKDKVVQTFVLAPKYTPMNVAQPQVSRINPAMKVFLGQTVWDDNDPAPDDFATVITLFFDSMDWNSMLPNPLTETDEYKVETDTGLLYEHLSVDLVCMNGYLKIKATLYGIYIGINAKGKKWYTPSVDGSASANSVTVEMDVYFTVDAAGNVTATIQDVKTGVSGLNVELDNDLLQFLVGWIINFFEGTFTDIVEEQMTDTIYKEVPPLLESAMEQLAFSETLTIPSIMGLDPINVTMDVRVSGINFVVGGATVSLAGAALLGKGNSVDSKGSAARGDCLVGMAPHAFDMVKEAEIALADDFLNQLLFSVWWSGLLEMDVGAEMLGGGSFEEFGIEDLSIKVKALRAPVVSDCEEAEFEMRLGDLELKASMNMFGMDTNVTLYASAAVGLEITVEQAMVDGVSLSQIVLGVTEIKWVKVELATVSANLVGSEDALRLLIRDQLMPLLLTQLTDGLMTAIPIPVIDLSSLAPGEDPIVFRVRVEEAGHEFGHSVMGGRIDGYQ